MRRRIRITLVDVTSVAAGCAYDAGLPDTVLDEVPAVSVMERQATALVRLLAARDRTRREKALKPSATAQVAFDCWLEQVVWSSDVGVSCKQRFATAIAQAEQAPTPGGKIYLVFFPWDQADHPPVAMAVLDQIATDYVSDQPSRVPLTGYADRSGSAAYNDDLSEQRVHNVARALVARGVPERALDVRWFGESRPRVATADGVREPHNRRVEIILGEGGSSA